MKAADRYARALFLLDTPVEAAECAGVLLRQPVLLRILDQPAIPLRQKEAVIDRLFPKPVQKLLKWLCQKGQVHLAPAIFDAYIPYAKGQAGVLSAELLYVTKPTEEQLSGMRQFLARRFSATSIELKLTESPMLLGGFILRAGGLEFDWSLRGRLQRLAQKLEVEVNG